MVRLIAAALGCLAMGCSQAPPARPAAPSKPITRLAQLPSPDPARGQPLAWTLDHYIYRDDVKGKNAARLVSGPLMDNFAREHHIEPTREQVARCERWMESLSPDHPAPAGSLEPMARSMVRGWLIDKALYQKYGGDVIFQQANPFEPVGAYRAFYEEQEQRGKLRIMDATLNEEFWWYLKRDHPFKVGKDQIDLSRPWWEK